jgi:hypothetical protein
MHSLNRRRGCTQQVYSSAILKVRVGCMGSRGTPAVSDSDISRNPLGIRPGFRSDERTSSTVPPEEESPAECGAPGAAKRASQLGTGVFLRTMACGRVGRERARPLPHHTVTVPSKTPPDRIRRTDSARHGDSGRPTRITRRFGRAISEIRQSPGRGACMGEGSSAGNRKRSRPGPGLWRHPSRAGAAD